MDTKSLKEQIAKLKEALPNAENPEAIAADIRMLEEQLETDTLAASALSANLQVTDYELPQRAAQQAEPVMMPPAAKPMRKSSRISTQTILIVAALVIIAAVIILLLSR